MNTPWINLIGGICLFIYGLNITKDNLQKMAGDKLTTILEKLTDNRFIAFFTGFLMTLMLQSSSACIAMAVGFASSSLLTLIQSMAIILGADVATTLTVQLISFNISSYSLLLISVGFIVKLFPHSRRSTWGAMIMGLGFVFLGMWTMSQAAEPFSQSEKLKLGLKLFLDYPLFSLFLGIIITAALQSSAAFLGILLSLAHSGLIPLTQALPLIIGANIGGCALPALTSIRSGDRGRQVALAHVLLKISGAILIFPFLSHFENWVIPTSADLSRQIANAHLMFNVMMAVLFLPFIHLGAVAINKIYSIAPQPEPFGPKFLDSNIISTPAFALGQAKREILRMASIIQEMLEKAMKLIKSEDRKIVSRIKELEDRSDLLHRAIKRYLIAISQQNISEKQADQQIELTTFINDLEDIGDTIDRAILPLATVKLNKPLKFSQEGFDEIKKFYDLVIKNFKLTLSAFMTDDLESYKKVLKNKEKIQMLEMTLRQTHLKRLRHGVQESIDTSAMHFELLSHFRRINSSICNIAYQTLADTQERLL